MLREYSIQWSPLLRQEDPQGLKGTGGVMKTVMQLT